MVVFGNFNPPESGTMKKTILSICALGLLASSSSFACPLENSNVMALPDQGEYKVLSDTKLTEVSRQEFKKLMGSLTSWAKYENCKDNLAERVIRDTSTGKIYTVVATNDDECDGGNSFGNMYEGEPTNPKKIFKQKRVADVEDSSVVCRQ
jgi:hypothetical protein